MDLRQLRYFVAIVEHGGYARAADRLGVTQSTLTQSMLKLEASLDSRLFDRGRFGARLTEAGALLLPRARLMAAEAQLAEREVRHSRQASRARVTIGLGKSIRTDLMPALVRRLRGEAPETAITIVEGWSPDLFEKLQHGEVDFALSAPLPHLAVPMDIRQEVLDHQTEAVVVGHSHPLAEDRNPTLEALAGHFWLMPPEGNGRIRYLQRVFEDAGVAPPASFLRSDSIPLGIALLEAGEIVAHGILDVIQSWLPPGAFVVLPIPSLSFERPIIISTRRRGRLQPAGQRSLAILRALVAERRDQPCGLPREQAIG